MPLTGPSQQTSACSLVLQADVFIFRPAQRRFFRNLAKSGLWSQHPSQTTAERILLIYAWNELGEGGYLVPTQADPSASYLQTLQATLNSSRQTGSSFPSAGSQ